MSSPAKSPRSARGALKRAVAELLASDPQRAWRFEEVAEELSHPYLGSVASCLSDAHRNPGSPIHRVGAGTYAWDDSDLVTKVQRILPTPTEDPYRSSHQPALGMMYQVVGYFSNQVILVGEDDALFLAKMGLLHLK